MKYSDLNNIDIYNNMYNLLKTKGFIDTTDIYYSIIKLENMLNNNYIDYYEVRRIYYKYKDKIDFINNAIRIKNSNCINHIMSTNINTDNYNEQVNNIITLIEYLYRLLILDMLKDKIVDNDMIDILVGNINRIENIISNI